MYSPWIYSHFTIILLQDIRAVPLYLKVRFFNLVFFRILEIIKNKIQNNNLRLESGHIN